MIQKSTITIKLKLLLDRISALFSMGDTLYDIRLRSVGYDGENMGGFL